MADEDNLNEPQAESIDPPGTTVAEEGAKLDTNRSEGGGAIDPPGTTQ